MAINQMVTNVGRIQCDDWLVNDCNNPIDVRMDCIESRAFRATTYKTTTNDSTLSVNNVMRPNGITQTKQHEPRIKRCLYNTTKVNQYR